VDGRDRNIAYVGAPQSGKTYAAKSECVNRYRFVFIDPTATVNMGRVIYDRDPVPYWRTIARTMDRDRYAQFTVRCQGDILPVVENCARVLEYYNKRQGTVSTLAIDEYGSLNRAKSGILNRVSAQGRHVGISLLLISQRVVDLVPSVRSNIEELRVFRTVERIDLDRLGKVDKALAQSNQLRGHESDSFDFMTGMITRIKG
jgi:hypothetical protein